VAGGYFYMKKKVLGFGCWVLGAYNVSFFMIRCVR